MNYEDFVKNNTGEIVEKLVTEVLKDAAEIRFEYEDNEQWSVISMHIYEEDKEISLQLHPNDRYELHFGHYDDEDEFHEIVQPLTDEQKLILPKALQKAMGKVLTDERGLRLPANFLSR